ncbi:hypothetical protein AX16_001931 [Volvariella volvacea WC 439]|nr:hypothetical protein AX16_001931 [Volvariella volvacea WC 439]
MFTVKLFSLVLLSGIALAEPILERRAPTNVFPNPPTTSTLSRAIVVGAGQTFTPSQPYTRYDRGSGACNGQAEGGEADAVFILEEGATLSRVVIGPNQAEGVHCRGSCTLDHVFWEDVCEDAVTIKQTSGTSRINYGGVRDSIHLFVQHNGGGTVIINNFYVEDFGKLYRSCGNCRTQYKRTVQINDVWAVRGSELVGINSTATIRRTRAQSVSTICQRYNGNSSGSEPTKSGSGPDGTYCLYSSSDITS